MRLRFRNGAVTLGAAAVTLGLAMAVAGAEPKPLWQQIQDDLPKWIVLPEAELRRRAEGGDSLAQYYYVIRTRAERPEDPARWELANRFLAKAVEGGVPHALFEAAELAQVREPEKYPALIARAAETGLPSALLLYGKDLYRGERFEVDEVRALELIRRSADAGHPGALAELGRLYMLGIGEPRHAGERVVELFRKAAAQGEGEAMLELGRRYRYGYTVERDVTVAAEWYWQAAQRGSSPPFPLLSENLEPLPGRDLEDRPFVEFYSLYAKAQSRREAEAMRRLGKELLKGGYGEPNAAGGYVWLRYAAEKGDAEARGIAEEVQRQLSGELVTQAESELERLKEEERARERAREIRRQEAERRAAERERRGR